MRKSWLLLYIICYATSSSSQLTYLHHHHRHHHQICNTHTVVHACSANTANLLVDPIYELLWLSLKIQSSYGFRTESIVNWAYLESWALFSLSVSLCVSQAYFAMNLLREAYFFFLWSPPLTLSRCCRVRTFKSVVWLGLVVFLLLRTLNKKVT